MGATFRCKRCVSRRAVQEMRPKREAAVSGAAACEIVACVLDDDYEFRFDQRGSESVR